MGSLGGGEIANSNKKALWVYPKVMGANPSERWGHSACYCNGLVYIFGGCRGGLHFSDVLVLNLETMGWNILVTTGQGPGPRDSHGAVVVGHKMIVFGGTNGCKKVNDLHVLDLRTLEWTQPECQGIPPLPRESHTATLVGDSRVVVFGGSGQGEANYLNDLHVLDLKTMRWTSPEVRGSYMPAPRDSHSAVALENKLFVYGGDCGDRYQGEVDVLDIDTFTWSRLDVHGPLPGVRAGHASVNFGSKIYVIGGVGDKQYYNDVWVLDVVSCTWTQIEVCGQKPQGRFSHTAIVSHSDIAIYGGCGEDERPLNELLILQLGAEHANGNSSLSVSRASENLLDYELKRFRKLEDLFKSSKENMSATDAQGLDLESKSSLCNGSETLHRKRRRMCNTQTYEIDLEADDHSLSLSQRSSSSQSDQELSTVRLGPSSATAVEQFPLLRKQSFSPNTSQSNLVPRVETNPKTIVPIAAKDLHLFGGEHHSKLPSEQHVHRPHSFSRVLCPVTESKPFETGQYQNMIGAEIHGKVDGAFDSGYLMTAMVNGKVFRGVLFAPGPDLMARGSILAQNPSQHHTQINVNSSTQHVKNTNCRRQPQQAAGQEIYQRFRTVPGRRLSTHVKSSPPLALPKDHHSHRSSDIQGVVLTLGGPGCGHAK
ncbi:PREDICTED: acyl-CoA-binding domain-containing protein 5-like [Ipomoea nil]|uniref:acyl-CoA-binding domain-containing protein 5-like n=1 Tax=Ipomoea nil TaxID=35883 RepID=UPI00090124A7|nr:PREDICTED: acyl-CoA-binding domain-containing protein 5-like [Ipomoea nil]